MSMILDNDMGMLFLDAPTELAEHGRLSDACHILQTDFGSTGFYQLVSNMSIILCCMNRTCSDAECGLGCHPTFKGIFDGGDDVTDVVESAEDTGDVHTLGMLHLVHQATHIGGDREHAQGIQSAVEHVCLDSHFVERTGEGTDSLVGILTIEKVDLFKGTAIGFYTAEASHLYDNRSYSLKLVLTGLKLATRLEHISIDERELNLSFFLCTHFDSGVCVCLISIFMLH